MDAKGKFAVSRKGAERVRKEELHSANEEDNLPAASAGGQMPEEEIDVALKNSHRATARL
jgi:hypothetical protein